MNDIQRIAQQRVLFREAMGKLRAIEELFGVEEPRNNRSSNELFTYRKQLNEFENWFFEEGPCA